jgi:hypothetical protein
MGPSIEPAEPPPFSDELFEQIERVLGLASPDQDLRDKLNFEVAAYRLHVPGGPLATEAVKDSTIRKKFRNIKNAASSLREQVCPDYRVVPIKDRPLMTLVRDRLKAGSIDLDNIANELERLCTVIDAQQKSKGGRPKVEAWNKMMREVMWLCWQKTGKPSTVTENEHCSGGGQRYSSSFVHVATIVDRIAASFSGTRSLPNSTLGRRLRRLTEG